MTESPEPERAVPGRQDFSEYEILDGVSRAIGPAPVCTASEAADAVGATSAGLFRRYHRLVHASYLHRRSIAGRSVVFWLTDKGEAALTRDIPIETDGYPTTPPKDTIDESDLTRREGREGRLGTFEPLELIQDANGPICTAGDICDAAGVVHSTALRRLNKLYRAGCVGRKECGSSGVVWWLTGLGEAVLSGDAQREAVEQRYIEADDSPPDGDLNGAVREGVILPTADGGAISTRQPGDDPVTMFRRDTGEASEKRDDDGMAEMVAPRYNDLEAVKREIRTGEPAHPDDENVARGRITPHPDDTPQARHERTHGGRTPAPEVSAYDILNAVAKVDAPAATTAGLADELGVSEQALRKHINRLVHADCLHLKETGAGRVYWPTTRGVQAVRNGGKNLRRRVLLGYPKTPPEPTVPYVYLSRREGREGRPDPFEPLELLRDARRAKVQAVSTRELADGLGLSEAATLNRLHKLRQFGLVDGVDAGSRVIAWGITDKGYEVLKDNSPYVDAEALETEYRNAPPARGDG